MARITQKAQAAAAHARRGDPDMAGAPYLYVIGNRHRHQKIGITAVPHERLHQLIREAGEPLEIWLLVGGRGLRTPWMEAGAHRLLAAHHLGNEWFDVTRKQALAAVIQAMLTYHEGSSE